MELGKPVAVPLAKKAAFDALTETPVLAWPTLTMAAVLIPTVLGLDALAFAGIVPLALVAFVNTVLYYFFFSVIHDGVHRAIACNKTFNDRLCQIAVSVYAPFAAMPLFRWAHMEHHRFTNDDRDPDDWVHGPWWSLPLRWMAIDVNYVVRAILNRSPAGKKVMAESLPFMVGGFAFLIAVFALGYGWPLFILWFVPSRLAFIGIGYSFFWLPHAHWPHEGVNLRQKDNFTIATTVRLGLERLLNPLLQFQNFHLVHHLWPTTPFYNNHKVWLLLEPEFRSRDLAVVRGLSVKPVYEFAGSRADG